MFLSILYTILVLPDIDETPVVSEENTNTNPTTLPISQTATPAPTLTTGYGSLANHSPIYEELPGPSAPDNDRLSLLSKEETESHHQNYGYQTLDANKSSTIDEPDRTSISSSTRDYAAASTSNLLENTSSRLSNRSCHSSLSECSSLRNKYSNPQYEEVENNEKHQMTFCQTFSDAVRTTFRRREDGLRAMIVANLIANSLSIMIMSGKNIIF